MEIKFNGAALLLDGNLTTINMYNNKIEVKTAETERREEFINIAIIEEVNFKFENSKEGDYLVLELPVLWVEEIRYF